MYHILFVSHQKVEDTLFFMIFILIKPIYIFVNYLLVIFLIHLSFVLSHHFNFYFEHNYLEVNYFQKLIILDIILII